MRSPRSMLLVEPCQDLAAILKSRIEELPFQVSVTHNAAAVKEIVKEQSFDVMLLDHDFLAADSLSLCAWLALRNGAPCVILLSNVVDSMLKLRAMACGVFACVPKQAWRQALPLELDRAAEMFHWTSSPLDSPSNPHLQRQALLTL